MPERPRSRIDIAISGVLGAAALGLYLSTLAPTLLGGDGGEFQFVPPLLGVAHPTGYPLYVSLGWAWSHLAAVGSVAYRMNFFSAVAAAAAVAVFYLAALRLLQQAWPAAGPVAGPGGGEGPSPSVQRLLAAAAALTLAATPTLWSQAVIAEVYGLHLLLVVSLLYVLLRWGADHRRRTLLLAALIFGFGLAHHRTTLLLAPAALLYVWLADRSPLRDRRFVLQALLLVLLPQLLYLLIPLRAPFTPYLRQALVPGQELVLYENTASNFLDFVLGGPFGGSLDLDVDLGQRLALAADLLHGEVGWVGILLAASGFLSLLIRRRWALLALTGTAYAATVTFNLVYIIGDIFVLFVPSYAVIVLWMALGVAWLVRLLASARGARRLRWIGAGVALLSLLIPAWLAATGYDAVDQSQNTRARDRWQAILSQPLPDRAVLVTDDRNNVMPLWYVQYVQGRRPDLLGLFPLITADYPTLGAVLDLALGTERPVYLIKEMPGIEVKVAIDEEPGVALPRVVGPAAEGEPDFALGVTLDGGVQLVGYDRVPRSPAPGEPLRIALHWEAQLPLARAYQSYVHLVDGTGQVVAQSDHRPGDIFYPTTAWRPGERLRDEHLLGVPAGTPPGVYHLIAGMYFLAEDGAVAPLGEPVALGPVAVKSGIPTEAGTVARRVGADFDQQIALVGYDTSIVGGELVVTLVWRALQAPPADYTVFVHLVDADGGTVAQHDGQPRDGAYPTSTWDADEVVYDEHRLPFPGGASARDLERYRLRVGLYRPATGGRLPVGTGGDSLVLALLPDTSP